jgi:hypothetical protein
MPFEVTSTSSVLAATPITLARHSAGRSRHRVARAHRPFPVARYLIISSQAQILR